MASSRTQEPPHPQTQCRLLSLPAEIRTYIYELALAIPPNHDGRIFVSSKKCKIHRWFMSSPSKTYAQETDTPSVLGLLQTCRLIHQEATGIFYHQHQIELQLFDRAEVGRFLLDLSRARLSSLRFLAIPVDYIRHATTVCESGVLAAVPRLETLVFKVMHIGNYMDNFDSLKTTFALFFLELPKLKTVGKVSFELARKAHPVEEQFLHQLNVAILARLPASQADSTAKMG